MTFDEAPSNGIDFSFEVLSERIMSHLGLTSFDDNTLRTLGLKLPDGSYNHAAEILADHNDLAGVDMVRFGATISEFLDRKTVTGVSVLQQYDAALEWYERYCTYEVVEGALRKKVERIPREAFREAVANALVHRVWDIPANVTIGIYDDKVVVTSPGGLPEGLAWMITSEEAYRFRGILLLPTSSSDLTISSNLERALRASTMRMKRRWSSQRMRCARSSMVVALPCVTAVFGRDSSRRVLGAANIESHTASFSR